ncbi:MAG TPA: hypothetical protein GXZ30_12365 [Propionibacterium sp.]|jgi:hypothetical protein|nr:hypothetical protein [Propionibacterium sp.]
MTRQVGERYLCEKCGAQLVYEKPCDCTTGRHEEICCGAQMTKVED